MNLSEIFNITQGIRKYYPVSDASLLELAQHLRRRKLSKHHHLYRAGMVDECIYFIEEGCARTYLLVDGKEVTSWFSQEGELIFSSYALYHQTEGFEYIQLLEDAIIYAMPIKELNAFYAHNIEMANWSRIIHQEVLLKTQRLRLDHLSLSAEQRYEQFIAHNPGLLQRVNLGYIASYLGMSPQHLSTLRANRSILR